MGNQAVSQGITRRYRKVIRVTPVLESSGYSGGDVLNDSTEIPNAVLGLGGCSMLRSISYITQQDAAYNMDIHFTQVQQNLGTMNAAPSISDDDLVASNYLGCVESTSSSVSDLGGARVWTFRQSTGDMGLPIFLQAEPGSTSVYFACIQATTETFAVDDLQFIFNIEY